jgi:hypothetical protein
MIRKIYFFILLLYKSSFNSLITALSLAILLILLLDPSKRPTNKMDGGIKIIFVIIATDI